ncbi:MAG: hypothetical protein JO322_01180 [Candidatus Eremiobacteraeota bacterium]|nr:hypothetical protein [Candidatus Eremiobacteraeota bacterium]
MARAALYGRVVLGASAVLFGIIALMWHDADTWQGLASIWKLPGGRVIGDFLIVAQTAGGIGLVFPRTARIASIVFGAVYAIFALDRIGGIIVQPGNFLQYDSFAEAFCLVCGAIAIYASTETNAAQASMLGRIARIGLGLCTIAFTLAQAIFLKATADLVPAWIPPSQMFWAILTTVAFALAAIAMLINRQAQLAMRLMTLMLVLFGLLVWVPIVIAHPQSHNDWSEFCINFLIAGAAWVVAELQSAPEASWVSAARTS